MLARLAAAGVPDPGFGDAAKYLQKLFHDSLTQGTPVGSMNERLVRLLEAKGLRFPMDSWQHDIEPATSEMEEKLQSLGVTTALPRTPIEAVFEAYADEDDDQLARRHFCAAIAREANTVLEQAGKPQRWFELADLPWEDDEPFWLLVTPAQREGLLREKIFKPAKAV